MWTLLWLALGAQVSIEQLRRREHLQMAPEAIEDPASQLREPGKLGVAVGAAGQLELREEASSFVEVKADEQAEAGLMQETEAEASKALTSVAVETGTDAALSAAEGAAAFAEHEAEMSLEEAQEHMKRVSAAIQAHLEHLDRTLPDVNETWYEHPGHQVVVGFAHAFAKVGHVGDAVMEFVALPVAWLARQAGAGSRALDRAAGNAAKRIGVLGGEFVAAEEGGGLFSALWHFIVTLVIIAFGLGVIKWYYSTGRKAPAERRSYLARRGSARASTVVREPLIPTPAA